MNAIDTFKSWVCENLPLNICFLKSVIFHLPRCRSSARTLSFSAIFLHLLFTQTNERTIRNETRERTNELNHMKIAYAIPIN